VSSKFSCLSLLRACVCGRCGKGEGFAELEYGILRWMGAIDDSTLVSQRGLSSV
jgi:hypothetical protein